MFLFSFTLYAGTCDDKYKFKVNGMDKTFCIFNKTKSLVSMDCSRGKCDSLKVLNSKKIKDAKMSTSELSGGKNPSTLLCKKIDGKLILGISELGHQQFFCQFNDKSMISTNSLMVKFKDMRDAKKAKK